MFETIINYETLDESSNEVFGFSNVIFKRDFGSWKMGDKVKSLWFSLEDSIVQEYSDKGTIVKSCGFKLEPNE